MLGFLRRKRRRGSAASKRRARTIWVSATALQVAYLYWGQPRDFEDWAEDRIEDERLRELLSHVYERMFAFTAFFVVPAGIARVGLGEPLSDFGLKLGKWWRGVPLLAASLPVATLGAIYASSQEDFQDEYPMCDTAREDLISFLVYEFSNVHYYIGWEFFYRGFLDRGLEQEFGQAGATAFQSVASTLMHIGKPRDGTIGAIFAGPGFAWMERFTDSVIYPTILHWWLGFALDAAVVLRTGGRNVPQPPMPAPMREVRPAQTAARIIEKTAELAKPKKAKKPKKKKEKAAKKNKGKKKAKA